MQLYPATKQHEKLKITVLRYSKEDIWYVKHHYMRIQIQSDMGSYTSRLYGRYSKYKKAVSVTTGDLLLIDKHFRDSKIQNKLTLYNWPKTENLLAKIGCKRGSKIQDMLAKSGWKEADKNSDVFRYSPSNNGFFSYKLIMHADLTLESVRQLHQLDKFVHSSSLQKFHNECTALTRFAKMGENELDLTETVNNNNHLLSISEFVEMRNNVRKPHKDIYDRVHFFNTNEDPGLYLGTTKVKLNKLEIEVPNTVLF